MSAVDREPLRKEMERRFYELKGMFDVGAIEEDEFQSEIEKLRFQDGEGRWWMIGAQSGKWYVYDGMRWIPSRPPGETAPAAPSPPQQASTQPAPQKPGTVPTGSVISPKGREPAPAIPRAAPAASLSPRPLHVPLPGLILIGCGMLTLVLIVAFWIVVENFVPGKPISTALGVLVKPVAAPTGAASVATATRAAQSIVSVDSTSRLITVGDDLVLRSLYDSAIAQYQAANQLAPTDPLPLTRWSRALAFRGQLGDALTQARQATQRAPNDAQAQAQLARVLTWLGQTGEAITTGERAVQLDPKDGNAHATLAEAYLTARRIAEAQGQAQLALQLAPQSAEAHRAQAWALTLSGQPGNVPQGLGTVPKEKDAALAEWKQTLALEPNLSFRHFEFAEVLRVFFKDPASAVPEYRRALELNGAYVPAHNALGIALISVNQPQQAIAPLQRAATLDPQNANNYAYLGLAFGASAQCSQAIPYFEQALRIDLQNPVAAKGLSECQSGKTPALPPAALPSQPLAPPTVPSPSR